MIKCFIFLLIAVSLFVSLGLSSENKAHENQSVSMNPTPTPMPGSFAKIEKVDLDRTEVFIPCPPGIKPQAKCDETYSIKAKISAVNPRNAELSYQYIVSGGRIIGQGANVTWNLSGVRKGTYTITVNIDDGSESYIESQTKTIEVKECYCPIVDACPIIDISTSTDSVKAGETVTFTAKVSGVSTADISYNWTVSSGTIIEGQGTSKIKVETTRDMAGSYLTAVVAPQGMSISSSCETDTSQTVSIKK